MNEKIYQIQPVANGYIVMLPLNHLGQFEGLIEATQKIKALDGGLPAPERETKSTVYIFTKLADAMGFLSMHISGDL